MHKKQFNSFCENRRISPLIPCVPRPRLRGRGGSLQTEVRGALRQAGQSAEQQAQQPALQPAAQAAAQPKVPADGEAEATSRALRAGSACGKEVAQPEPSSEPTPESTPPTPEQAPIAAWLEEGGGSCGQGDRRATISWGETDEFAVSGLQGVHASLHLL